MILHAIDDCFNNVPLDLKGLGGQKRNLSARNGEHVTTMPLGGNLRRQNNEQTYCIGNWGNRGYRFSDL